MILSAFAESNLSTSRLTEAASFEVGVLTRRRPLSVRVFPSFFPRWGRGRGEARRSVSSVSGRRVRTKSAGFDGTAAPRRRWGKNDAGFQFFVFSHQLRSKRQSPPSSSSKTSFVLSKTWIFPSAGRTKIFLAWPSSLSTSTTRAIFHVDRL